MIKPLPMASVIFLLAGCLAGIGLCTRPALAQPLTVLQKDDAWPVFDGSFGGHLRGIGTLGSGDKAQGLPATRTDGQAELRLKSELYIGSGWTLQTHYELVTLGGDVYENTRSPGAGSIDSLAPPYTVDDDRRLMDLTQTIGEDNRSTAYHRIDRLNLTVTPDWGTVCLGRQALTWGHGRFFNPMDLFNPFAPTAVQRDYKTGEDMALVQAPAGQGDVQALVVPRRDPASGDIAGDQSSVAVKWHGLFDRVETDVMAACHYDQMVAGLGVSGYLGSAAWRIDAVATRRSADRQAGNAIQIVANADWAWMWGGKNVYGLIEVYHNSLGRTGNWTDLLSDTDLVQRLGRGELYTLGRDYLAGCLQIELHPLVQLDATGIVNLNDASGLIQPQLLWDITGDLQLIAGAQWHWGGSGSEFGGYDISAADTRVRIQPDDRIYLWLTRYF